MTAVNSVVQYFEWREKGYFEEHAHLSTNEEPLSQFRMAMQISVQRLRRPSYTSTGTEREDLAAQCKQFELFTEKCKKLDTLNQDLQGAVKALEQMEKIDKAAGPVIGRLNQKKEQVEKLKAAMDDLHKQTQRLMTDYEQRLSQKEGDCTIKLRKPASRGLGEHPTPKVSEEDDDWEAIPPGSPTDKGPPVTFPAFTIASSSTDSSPSSSSSSTASESSSSSASDSMSASSSSSSSSESPTVSSSEPPPQNLDLHSSASFSSSASSLSQKRSCNWLSSCGSRSKDNNDGRRSSVSAAT